jgi:hypothetical protein
MKKYGYIRVSSSDQNEDRQLIAMQKQGMDKADEPSQKVLCEMLIAYGNPAIREQIMKRGTSL